MSNYQGNIIIKNPTAPAGPAENGSAPGIWKLSEAMAFKRQGIWPTQGVLAGDPYLNYVSLLLSTTSLGNANNNLFVDSSGAFNPLSRNGNATQGSFTPYSANWSNYLDNSGDYLTTGAGSSAFAFGTGNFTIEGWFYANTAVANWKPMLSIGAAAQGQLIRINQGLQFTGNWGMLYPNDAGNADVYFDTGSPFPLNQWVHVALVRNGTTLTLYQNGVNVLQKTVGFNFTNTTGVSIGYGQYAGDGFFGGYVSNIRIVKGTAVYTANFTPPTSALTAISGTSLLTCQSNRFRDASTNNFTITRNGDTRVTDFSPFLPTSAISYNQSDITNWSGYFDGTSDWLATPSNAVFGFGTGDFTIECWMYPTSTKANMRLWEFSGNSDNVDISNAGTTGAISYYNGSISAVSSGGVVVFNAWNHVACVRSSGTVRIYLNGVLRVTQASTPNTSTRTLYIGGQGSDWFQGAISNFRVVKGTAVYTGAFTPPTAPLTAISGTSLLTLQNAAFTDNSTNNFVLTPNGNTTVTGNSPFNTVGYWSLSGTSTQGATIPQTTATDLGSGSFTVECWVNTTSYDASFVTKRRTDTALTGSWMLAANSSGFFTFQGVGWASSYQATTNAIPLGAWTHLAVSRSGTNLSMFVNGTRVYNVTDSYNYTCSTYTIIKLGGNAGGNYPSGGALFGGSNGSISNLRIVQGTAVYNPASTTVTVPTSPLTAISGTSLLTCQDATMKDNSTNNNTSIALYSGAAIQPFNPFYTATIPSNGGSMYFDGSGDYLRSTITPLNIRTAFTIDGWVYLTTVANFVFFSGSTTAGSAGAALYLNEGGGTMYFGDGVANNITFASSSIPTNSWAHIACTFDGTTYRVFINGTSVGSSTTLLSNFTLNGIDIGARLSGVTNYTTGYMSGFRITGGTALYTAAFTPPTSPANPTPATTLLVNGMNAGIYDATAINDMETVGNAQVRFPTPFAPANYWAGSFDGNGDYLSLSNKITFGTGDFTVEGWIYRLANTSIYDGFFSLEGTNGDWNSGGGGIAIACGNLHLAGFGNVNYSSSVPLNQWTHIACSRSGTSVKVFLNGSEVASATSSASLGGTANKFPMIGAFDTLSGVRYPITGSISNVRVVTGTALYTSTFTPPTSPLTAISGTSLLTCQNKTFIDNSSNAFTITANGNATAGAVGPFTATGGTSMYFDGTGDYLTSNAANDLYAFGTGNFTIEMWFNLSSLANLQVLYDSRPNGTDGLYPCIFVPAGGASVNLQVSGASQITGTAALSAGVWYHLALSRSSGSTRMFLNGTQIGSTYADTNAYLNSGTTRPFIGGSSYSAGTLTVNGYIEEVRVTKGYARYTTNFTPPTQAFPLF